MGDFMKDLAVVVDKQLSYSGSRDGTESPKRKRPLTKPASTQRGLRRKGIAQAVPRHPQFYIRSHEMKTVLIAACASLVTIFVIRPIEKKKGGE